VKIDIHTHILPPPEPEWPRWMEKFGYGGFMRLKSVSPCSAHMLRDDGKFFRAVESKAWDPAKRLEECDEHGVKMQVISTVPAMFSYWAKPDHGLDLSRWLNDHVAAVVRGNPTRFRGLASVPMQAPLLASRELERAVKELGLDGVQIGSHVGDLNLSDPTFAPVWETAEKLDAAVFVHPWDMMGEAKMQKYWLPWLVGMPAETSLAICSMIFGGVFEKYPKLRVCFAHGGGAFPGTFGRIQHGFEARPDLCAVDNPHPPSHYIGRFYVDSLVHDASTLRHLIELFGADKIALGTDYPFPLGEARPGALIESLEPLDRQSRDRLLFGTAQEWLGKSK